MGYEKVEGYDGNSGIIRNQKCKSYTLDNQIYLVNLAFVEDHIDGKIFTFLNSSAASEVRRPERKSTLHKLLTAELQKLLTDKV